MSNCGGAEGDVAAEVGGIEGNLEAVVVAFAADEGDDVASARVAFDEEEAREGVEGDDEGVVGDGADKAGGGGIGTPVDGVDGKDVAVGYHGDGAVGRADGIVADGDADIVAVVGGIDAWGGIEVFLSDMPADDVGRYQAVESLIVHALEQVDDGNGPLAEAREDEGTATVEVLQIVVESLPNITQGQRHPPVDKAVGGEGLEGALAVVGGVEVEVAGEESVDARHLAEEKGSEGVVVGVGIVAGKTGDGVVARLGGDDIEDVDGALPVDDVPLGRVGVVGLLGEDFVSPLIATRGQQEE